MKRKIVLWIVPLFLLSCNSAEKNTDKDNAGNENPKTAPAFVYGIDISKFQGEEIDFLNGKQDTLSFVICKATEGIKLRDPDFGNNWRTIAAKGFTRGAYHFYHSREDPVKQAAFFLSVVGALSKEDFPPIVDVEETGIAANQSVELAQNNLMKFLKEIESRTGRTPIIYTDHNIGNKYLTGQAFAGYPLWVAAYQNKAPAVLPGAWKGKKWTMWQKSDTYTVSSQRDDFDVFNGSQAELKEFVSKH